jgi:hypothetical protein
MPPVAIVAQNYHALESCFLSFFSSTSLLTHVHVKCRNRSRKGNFPFRRMIPVSSTCSASWPASTFLRRAPRGLLLASLLCSSLEVPVLFSCSASSASSSSFSSSSSTASSTPAAAVAAVSTPLPSTSSSNGFCSTCPGCGVSTCSWFRHWRRSAALEVESDEARRGL